MFDAIKQVQDGQFKGGTDVIDTHERRRRASARFGRRAPSTRRRSRTSQDQIAAGDINDIPGHGQVARSAAEHAALELRGITKKFGARRRERRRSTSTCARRGPRAARRERRREVDADVVLYGLYRPDEGEIRVDGRAGRRSTRRRGAIDLGIGMVHQHFMLVPVMTVAENIVLGEEPRAAALLDVRGGARAACRSCPTATAWPSTPTPRSRTSSVGEQQRVEILQALYRDAGILSSTSRRRSSPPRRPASCRASCAALAQDGTSIVFITHKLRRGARDRRPRDRAAARKEGRHRADRGRDRASLARLMVGRDVLLRVDKAPAQAGRRRCSRSSDLHVRRRPRAASGARGCR